MPSEERSPLLPLEARPDSTGDSGVQPRDPFLPLRVLLEKLGPTLGNTLEGDKNTVDFTSGWICSRFWRNWYFLESVTEWAWELVMYYSSHFSDVQTSLQ